MPRRGGTRTMPPPRTEALTKNRHRRRRQLQQKRGPTDKSQSMIIGDRVLARLSPRPPSSCRSLEYETWSHALDHGSESPVGARRHCTSSPDLFPKVDLGRLSNLDEEDQETKEPDDDEDEKESTFWSFIQGELRLRPRELNQDYRVQAQRVWNFLRLILVLERLLAYGMSVCLDQFLLTFTLLPIRAGFATIAFATSGVLRREYLRDLCNLVLLATAFMALGSLHFSQIYHLIRAQSFMKLYVLYNMLQLFARLFYSLGEDLLDALYGCCSKPKPEPVQLLLTLGATSVYMSLHAMFMCVQIVTLNVSVNSNDKTLLVILISSQFVELKSMCFKKFGHKNLFQLAMSDVVERFEMCVFMIILIIQNTAAIGIGTKAALDWLRRACYVGLLLGSSECLVDWLKHGFIIKFNMIDPGIYKVYHLILCGDVTKEARPSSDIPSLRTTLRRFGFIPIPLAAIVLRVVWDAVAPNTDVRALVVIATIANLMALKLLLRIFVLGHASKHVFARDSDLNLQPTAFRMSDGTKRDKEHTNSKPKKAKSSEIVKARPNGEAKKSGHVKEKSIGRIPSEIAEKYTSMFPETYRPIDGAEKLAGVSRYVLLESRVP